MAIQAGEEQIAQLQRHVLRVSLPTIDRISYLQSGPSNGRRILYVHGTPGNAFGWADYLIDAPAGRCHIALDRPGYGGSRIRKAAFSLKEQAGALLPFLNSDNGKKAIVVGHSSGAAVAIQAALHNVEAVGGLLLLAGAVDPDLEEANWIQLLGTYKPISRLLPKTIDTANRELLGLKRELLAQADKLHGIRIPVNAVHGDMDPLVPSDNLKYLKQKLTNASIEQKILRRKDHFIPWHSKPAIDEALEHLVERVRRTE